MYRGYVDIFQPFCPIYQKIVSILFNGIYFTISITIVADVSYSNILFRLS